MEKCLPMCAAKRDCLAESWTIRLRSARNSVARASRTGSDWMPAPHRTGNKTSESSDRHPLSQSTSHVPASSIAFRYADRQYQNSNAPAGLKIACIVARE